MDKKQTKRLASLAEALFEKSAAQLAHLNLKRVALEDQITALQRPPPFEIGTAIVAERHALWRHQEVTRLRTELAILRSEMELAKTQTRKAFGRKTALTHLLETL